MISGIKDFKKIFLKKCVSSNGISVQVKGSAFFNYDEQKQYASIIKRGRSDQKIDFKVMPLGNPISAKKKKNVISLLEKQFNGDDFHWPEVPDLNFYKETLLDNVQPSQEDDETNS
ncbi:unnamed protein product [Acanthoscelides obtectus]|uniref:Uncharacterized protein n=1 Tax=Acanthoscelides obtectus TaxID=200917 RepID=A0A9P0K2F0_ACAOB|nr:unnamed protein product [Acanthoscelides obtectus]CAK1627528.1 hypothetical protein AOBTE_LOCUS4643 [Acanthoscelides obtectus]